MDIFTAALEYEYRHEQKPSAELIEILRCLCDAHIRRIED